MARWSQTHAEHVHIATISQQIPIAGIARITLYDGSTIEGVLRNVHIGNNAGHGGWKYRGELEIETKERTRWTFDVCVRLSPLESEQIRVGGVTA